MSATKRKVDAVLANLKDEDRKAINEIATQPIYSMYLLPAQQVDELHRIFMRTINKNRDDISQKIYEANLKAMAEKAAQLPVEAAPIEQDHVHAPATTPETSPETASETDATTVVSDAPQS